MLLESSIFTFLRVRVTGFLPMGSLVEECWTPQELTGIRMNLQPSMSWSEAVRHSHQPKTEPTNVYRYTVYIYKMYASRHYCISCTLHTNKNLSIDRTTFIDFEATLGPTRWTPWHPQKTPWLHVHKLPQAWPTAKKPGEIELFWRSQVALDIILQMILD